MISLFKYLNKKYKLKFKVLKKEKNWVKARVK